MTGRLIAAVPILAGNRQYQPGDALPTEDAAYIAAWIEAGSATWEDAPAAGQKHSKARLLTAKPGRAGISSTGSPGDLVGQVTETPERKLARRRGRNEF